MNRDIKIVDDLLPKGYADQIQTDITRIGFPWVYVDDVTYITGDKESGNPGLTHVAYDITGNIYSEYMPFFKPMIYHIEEANGVPINELLRIRVGLISRVAAEDNVVNTPHVDFIVPHYTACYYVEDSDGDTVVYDQWLDQDTTSSNMPDFVKNTDFTVASRGKPKKNRVVIFNGHRYHASSHPLIHKKRLVITVNYR
jgi:hypothetical protein